MTIKAATVQMPFLWVTGADTFREWLAVPVGRAAEEGAQLVVLPPYCGLALLGAVLPLEPDMRLADAMAVGGYPTLADGLRDKGALLREAYETVGSLLAVEHGLWLAAGTVVAPEGDGVYHTAYLFDPDGEVVGRQHQTHLSARERSWGLSRGDTLKVFDAPVGRLGFVVGSDVLYPEVSRILALQGANVLVHPTAGVYTEADWLRRLWREVQANQVFGLEAPLLGDVWGQPLTGRATLHVPLNVTRDRRGVLAQALSTDRAEVVVAELDFVRLQWAVDDYPIFSVLNYGMYERYFPHVYRGQV